MRLPEHIITDVYENESVNRFMDCSGKGYFPVYDIPEDACFVIRQGELDKLLGMPAERFTHSSSSRLSTPLSRLFWLACKHNGLPDFDDTQRLEFLALDESELALASSR